MTKGRNMALVRVLALLRLLEGRGRHTLDDLSVRFNVTTRTVRRDLAALQSVGYPIGHDEKGDTGCGGRSAHGMWWLA